MEFSWAFLWALLPSIGVSFLFYVAIKAIFEADRRERAALARYERQNAAEANAADTNAAEANAAETNAAEANAADPPTPS